MSSEAMPISAARFAAALENLPLSSLRLKVLEIRNSVHHLIYSNAELKPFADADPPDLVCADAIRENEIVLERMAERLALLRDEIERKGGSWEELDEVPDVAELDKAAAAPTAAAEGTNGDAPSGGEAREHPAWRDGTFQVGTIRLGDLQETNGEAPRAAAPPSGGRLSDEELARQLAERMRLLEDGNDEAEGGLHL